MRYSTLCRIQRVTEKIESILYYVGLFVGGIIVLPALIVMKWHDWYQKKKIERLIDKHVKRSDNPEELSSDIEKGRVRIAELPHNRKNYTMEHDLYLYPFHTERSLVLDSTSIAYVENLYCERMHRFFLEQAEWIKDFEHWHGVRLVFVDGEHVKEGMFFPQDFYTYMNHGLLWNQHASLPDPEYGFLGDNHYYVEITLASDEEIKQQMHIFMSKVYDKFT